MMKAHATVEREPGEKNFSCLLEIDSLKSSVLGVGNRKPSEARKKQIESGLKVLAQQIQSARIY